MNGGAGSDKGEGCALRAPETGRRKWGERECEGAPDKTRAPRGRANHEGDAKAERARHFAVRKAGHVAERIEGLKREYLPVHVGGSQ